METELEGDENSYGYWKKNEMHLAIDMEIKGWTADSDGDDDRAVKAKDKAGFQDLLLSS